MTTFSKRFLPTFDEYIERHGEPFTVERKLTPMEVGPNFAEVGDMYRIRFEDGTIIHSWPEEVLAESAKVYPGYEETQEVEV